ncbi:uncharacterized protein EI90DRAFT_536621 [Cantharellus anzutake]|uniref:uncharacterized protein n=1 Tax=Cantharellus anzutake TaxID=1750568 RepID=UPI001904F8F7|nr:uncharacterized protein EI90DRAFT_536621 [Cantharellus anzutake]KAF8334318.1 hypothetical protein EI90DRAFT_536621 [Cantharellus anzutake]
MAHGVLFAAIISLRIHSVPFLAQPQLRPIGAGPSTHLASPAVLPGLSSDIVSCDTFIMVAVGIVYVQQIGPSDISYLNLVSPNCLICWYLQLPLIIATHSFRSCLNAVYHGREIYEQQFGMSPLGTYIGGSVKTSNSF